MPPNVHGLKDVNEAVRPAAASPRKSLAEELADALQLGAYAAEDQKNERWKDARRGFFAAHMLVHAPNDKQVAARSEAFAFRGEGHSIAGPRDEGVVAVPPAIHPLAAAAPSSAGAAPPPTPAAAKTKPSKVVNIRTFDKQPYDPFGGGRFIPPPLPPTRFQVGERVQCNMGLKDGTTSWFAGIVEAIDVWECLDGTVRKQYKYRVKLDDRTIGCAFAPEDTEYCIRAEGGTPASPDLPPPTPSSAFGSFRFGVGDSVACLMWTDDHRKAWFPGVVTHVGGRTQGRYYVYLVQLDDGRIAYVPTDSDACCVSKTPKVVVTALGTFSTTHENAVARDALELVQKLLLNVIKNPDERKYRIVKLDNQRLQTKLFCLSGGIALMQSLGFEKHANEELELPRIKPIATLTRCHLAVQDALDLLARRAVTTTHAPADSAPEQPMVPARQSTITTEMERLWKAQESANVPMLPERAKSVRSQLVEDLKRVLQPILSSSSQSEALAIYCAANAEIQRLESLPAGYSAADLLQQRLDAPSPTESGVFGTPDAMAVVRTLQVPYNWRKGMTLIFEYEGERIKLVAPEGTQPGDMVMLTLPRDGGAPPSPIDAPPSPIVFQEEPTPNPKSPFNQVQVDGRLLAQALVDRILNQISVSPDRDDIDYRDDLIPKRSMSKVAPTAAAAIQKELAEAPATDSVWAGDRPVSWSTFLLPADAAARRLFPLANLSSETNIVDPLSGRSCLAWQPPVSCAGTVEPELLRASELHPLSTKGDGNCLLHAAALGAWGVHDQAGTKNVGVLRSMVFNLLNNEQFVRVLLPRMRAEQVMHLSPFASLLQIREYAGTPAAISEPSNDDVFREEVQQALGRAGRSGCYLEKLHIFVLAHAMRRPIVVYHYDSDQPQGTLISGMSGIYLPDLWGELGYRDVCSRVPLCLVYTGSTANGQGHFTACVGAEGHALVLPLSDHVHGERLLIRYGPDHVDIRPATLVDTPAAGPTDSWAAHAALHLELTWSAASDSGDLYDEEAKAVAPARVRSFPFAFVSRTPADSRLMLPSVAELRDQFVAEVTRSAVELRIGPDGVAYTKNQFVEFYGGILEWDQAAPLGSAMPTTAPAPPTDTAPFP
eukprot:jgi/Chrpa1/28104/Chrysochromulina_OHIO_Genome00004217-RA